MLTIYLTRRIDSSFALRISCPDSDIFQSSINSLKFVIPANARVYDRLSKCWIILAQAVVELESYLSTMTARFCADVVASAEAESNAHEEYNERRQKKQSAPDDEHGQQQQRESPFDRRQKMTLQRAYATLFITANAPAEVIQGAYRALAKLHHPDLGGDGKTMRTINHAYEVLMDELKRQAASSAA